MVLRVVVLVSALVILGSSAVEAAPKLFTGPVRVAVAQAITCAVANVSTRDVNTIAIVIRFVRADGTSSGTSLKTCNGLAPGRVCIASVTGATNDFAAFCEVSSSASKSKIRGTLCNVTVGLCSDLR